VKKREGESSDMNLSELALETVNEQEEGARRLTRDLTGVESATSVT
jgi:hypothetical protein